MKNEVKIHEVSSSPSRTTRVFKLSGMAVAEQDFSGWM
jgi:hypothetical protein